MAKKTLTPVQGKFNAITKFAFEAATSATDGFELTLKANDEYTVVLATNTDGTTAYDITVKKPTAGSYAAVSADKVLELAAGEFAIIRIESAKYANNDGTVKLIPENVAVKVVALY